jgi:hypothetical protein
LSGQASSVPVLVLREGSGRSRGRDAQRNNIMAAKTIAEAVKSALGPKGMDKMLVESSGDVTITSARYLYRRAGSKCARKARLY